MIDIENQEIELVVPAYFDENSQTWAAMKEMLESLLADTRKRNDSFRNTPDQTAAIRGEVKLLKQLLKIPEKVRKGRAKRPQTIRQDF